MKNYTEEIISKPQGESLFALEQINLTDDEKAVLIKEFDTVLIQTIRSELRDDKLIVGYKLGSHKVEFPYSYPQNQETLESLMEIDRIRWLKDIAATLSKVENVSAPDEGVVDEIYAF